MFQTKQQTMIINDTSPLFNLLKTIKNRYFKYLNYLLVIKIYIFNRMLTYLFLI